MERQTEITISKLAHKQIQKIPHHIQDALKAWIKSIIEAGLIKTRKTPAYHDEPLKGNRNGQRSVRLNRSYRIIYEEASNGHIILIVILEVNKHDY